MDHLTTADPQTGLTSQEAQRRAQMGLDNRGGDVPTKSVGAIFRTNLITPFNLLNLVLALLVALVGSWKNLLFMGVILCNIVIGIVQELRAKATIDRLSLIASPKAHVRRDGQVLELPLEELVLGDVLVLTAGNQVGADCVVAEGTCRMDESLLTGESEPVERGVGDTLLSGSFLLSGRCVARAVHVGADNYASKITAGAKRLKPPDSEILSTVNKIIRAISFVLLPMGLAMFIKQWFFTHSAPQAAVVSTVAALVGMIPEGLVLLTSVVMAVSVIRLARRGALVQELYSIEMLARVDVLCLDKTGTLTTGALQVEQLIPLGETDGEGLRAGLSSLLAATGDENPTAAALKAHLEGSPCWSPDAAAPFRADRKWSGASFPGHGCWVLGAPEFVLPHDPGDWQEQAHNLSAQGLRVLALARCDGPLGDGLPPQLVPAGLVVLSDQLRAGAGDTLDYFAQQGVELKVISGDDPRTVSAVALRAGLRGAERWVDASTLVSEEATRNAAERYTVFGRVTPQQKLWLVQALKAAGHHVAMTGDGVNDVLALKESDCGVAMAAGSEAARNVSRIVLMDSDFSAMPHIVAEGRRAINNLQRSAALFLTKTMFSTIIALCFLFLTVGYPFQPIQLSLISTITIGAPSFLLALEPNRERLRGHFAQNVLSRSVPGAIAMAANVLFSVAAMMWLPMSPGELSTLCVLLVGFAGLVHLLFVAQPMTVLHGLLVGAACAAFYGAAYLLRDLFSLQRLSGPALVLLLALMTWTVLCYILLRYIVARILARKKARLS